MNTVVKNSDTEGNVRYWVLLVQIIGVALVSNLTFILLWKCGFYGSTLLTSTENLVFLVVAECLFAIGITFGAMCTVSEAMTKRKTIKNNK